MAYSEPVDIYVHSELELCVKEILSCIKPTVADIQNREIAINELTDAIQMDHRLSGVANNMKFIRLARVPLVVYQSRCYNISCDISIDNQAGYVKSCLLRLISYIDERFRELVLLIKECAKAQHLNDPRAGTLNSYSLCLLIIFHFQTCRPAIFPPLRDLYKGNIVNDLKGI
ncbi:poly(A) RNA polymerase GLD2 [Dendrobium catenatum]|uniref:Poly(A) RNA polymerase GLD2 n=1 Tax=Dendrobium catenatum TaxID=906689 RepID=A0A2I0W8E3_9ASPA|nr:poly(A) RNA polymerase GLD2 [Dendrobium catenatum]